MVLENFVVFEGLDGSGTSTQIKLIGEKIPSEKCFITAEPTENEIGKFLRKMLQAKVKLAPKTAAYLFASDRCEHVYGENGILQNCQNGKIVLSDRYLFSSLAYQSPICGKEMVSKLNQDFPLPKILFFFEIDPKDSLNRVFERSKQTGAQTEIYEKLEIQQKTYQAYQNVILDYEKSQNEMQIIRIDATKSIEQIHEKIWNIIQNMPIFKA